MSWGHATAMDVDMVDDVPGLMDVLPDAIVQNILSSMKNARDVASCSSVCKRWREFMAQVPNLHFPRTIGDDGRSSYVDRIVTRMVLSTCLLKELTVYCHFSSISLVAWLSHAKSSLTHLELRVDDLSDKQPSNSSMSKIEPLACVPGLQVLRLWGVQLSERPRWNTFANLHTLDIVGARLHDVALRAILVSCPVLINLAVLGCSGVHYATVEMAQLKHCRLDFYGTGDCCVKVTAPKLELLEVQGASCLHVVGDQCLRHLSVANNQGKVKKLEVGKAYELKSLCLRGVQWCWEAVSTILRKASELEELSMRVEFCGEGDKLEPFPELDFVDFFSCFPKLKAFELQGAMFAALSHQNSLVKLTPAFTVEYLEKASFTIRSPLNADQKIATLESFLKCSPNLKLLVIKVSQMKNCESAADDFFLKILGLKFQYEFIQIE